MSNIIIGYKSKSEATEIALHRNLLNEVLVAGKPWSDDYDAVPIAIYTNETFSQLMNVSFADLAATTICPAFIVKLRLSGRPYFHVLIGMQGVVDDDGNFCCSAIDCWSNASINEDCGFLTTDEINHVLQYLVNVAGFSNPDNLQIIMNYSVLNKVQVDIRELGVKDWSEFNVRMSTVSNSKNTNPLMDHAIIGYDVEIKSVGTETYRKLVEAHIEDFKEEAGINDYDKERVAIYTGEEFAKLTGISFKELTKCEHPEPDFILKLYPQNSRYYYLLTGIYPKPYRASDGIRFNCRYTDPFPNIFVGHDADDEDCDNDDYVPYFHEIDGILDELVRSQKAAIDAIGNIKEMLIKIKYQGNVSNKYRYNVKVKLFKATKWEEFEVIYCKESI